jgi:FAD:protein FMN transferase
LDPVMAGKDRSQAPASPAEYRTPVSMRREQFRAMGTTISLLLPESQTEAGTTIVRTLFTEWEQKLSRFLPESELSQLNQRPGEPVAVSDLLYHVLTTALTAARVTQGVYDPALQDQLVLLGYDRSFDDLPAVSPNTLFLGRPGGGWRRIQVDRASRRVTLPVGVKLDFGGMPQQGADFLRQHRIAGLLVREDGTWETIEPWPVHLMKEE